MGGSSASPKLHAHIVIKKGGTLSIHFPAHRNIHRVPPYAPAASRLALSPNMGNRDWGAGNGFLFPSKACAFHAQIIMRETAAYNRLINDMIANYAPYSPIPIPTIRQSRIAGG